MLLERDKMSFISNDTAAADPLNRQEVDEEEAFAEHVYHKMMNEGPRTTGGTDAFDHRINTMKSLRDYLTKIDYGERADRQEDELDITISQNLSDNQSLEVLERELESFNETDEPYGDLRRAYEELNNYVEEKNVRNRK